MDTQFKKKSNSKLLTLLNILNYFSALKELFSGGQGEVHAATEEPVVEEITEGSTDQPIDPPIDQS